MLAQFKAHVPIVGLALVAFGVFVAQNRSLITADQATAILGILGVGTAKLTLQMTPPRAA